MKSFLVYLNIDIKNDNCVNMWRCLRIDSARMYSYDELVEIGILIGVSNGYKYHIKFFLNSSHNHIQSV